MQVRMDMDAGKMSREEQLDLQAASRMSYWLGT
jgi:hypothetical protein